MPNTYPRGSIYIFDEDRAKMVSINRVYLTAGADRRTVSNEFLRLSGGQPSMVSGDMLIRNATIIGLTANCETPSTWVAKIFSLGNPVPLVTLPIVSSTLASDQTLNRDVDAGTVIQFFAEGTNIPFPRVMLEIAWRPD